MKPIVEIKQINDDFSIYKYSVEETVKYGLCFNYEIENLHVGVLPKEGQNYRFITKTDMNELIEYHIKEQNMEFELEDFMYDNDDLFAFYDALIKENSFEKGYFIKVDEDTKIIEEYYDKLPVIFPIKIEKRLVGSKYNLLRAEYLLKNRKDVLIDCFEEEDMVFIKKTKNEKYIDFYWFPNKNDWKLFKETLHSNGFKEATKFLIENILNIPLKTEPPEEKRVEIKTDLRIQGQTVKINETFGLYQYTYKVNGELFSHSDICFVEEIPDFQKKLVLPNKITCKEYKEDLEKYVIVKKEYLNLVKTQTADVPYRVEDSEYIVEPDYFMNLPTEIHFEHYVILKKMGGYLSFPYIDTRTNLPIIHPITFEHCNCNPVNCGNYNLKNIEDYLKDNEQIYFVNKSGYFLDFNFYPNQEEWEKMCAYISKKTCLKGSILLQHFLNNKEKEDFMLFVLDEILKLPKGGANNG